MSANLSRWLRRGAGVLAVLLAVAGVGVGLAVRKADAKMHRTVPVSVQPLALRDDAQALARGQYLFNSRGCAECHGVNGAGRTFVNDGGMHLAGSNISPGPGSVVSAYRDEDWVRILRHGVKPNGQPALIMPSEDYNQYTDQDLAALIGYVRHLAPVSGQGAVLEMPVPVRVLYALGVVTDAAERIDHSLPPPAPVQEGVTAAHGAYVANMCLGCHGPHLSGGLIPGAPPSWPAAANLTQGAGSVMPRYASADAFVQMLRSGRRPDGSAIQVMPFETLKQLSDTDARAVHAYLQTVSARPAGGR